MLYGDLAQIDVWCMVTKNLHPVFSLYGMVTFLEVDVWCKVRFFHVRVF